MEAKNLTDDGKQRYSSPSRSHRLSAVIFACKYQKWSFSFIHGGLSKDQTKTTQDKTPFVSPLLLRPLQLLLSIHFHIPIVEDSGYH